jgi:hypothetical protein
MEFEILCERSYLGRRSPVQSRHDICQPYPTAPPNQLARRPTQCFCDNDFYERGRGLPMRRGRHSGAESAERPLQTLLDS